jgi:nitroreductase
MRFYDVIKQRKSIREYVLNKPVPDDVLNRILDAGRCAPSASNRQPWKILAIRDETLRQRVCRCYRGEWLKSAPIILVVIGYRDQAWIRQKDGHCSLEVDLTIAMDHMILAAAAENIGSCWIMAFDYDVLREVLKLNENQFVSCITPLGYAADAALAAPDSSRKKFEEVIEII